MLTLMEINRALDRLGVEALIPRTQRALAGSLPTSSRRVAPATTLPGRRRPEGICRDPYGFRDQAGDGTRAPGLAATLDREPEDIRATLRAWRAAHASERGGRMIRVRLPAQTGS